MASFKYLVAGTLDMRLPNCQCAIKHPHRQFSATEILND